MRGEEEQVNVEGHSEGTVDRGRTGHGGRLAAGMYKTNFRCATVHFFRLVIRFC